ncbi:hypothetical protein BDW69DRAFT_165856 [Aspergillus filifer]
MPEESPCNYRFNLKREMEDIQEIVHRCQRVNYAGQPFVSHRMLTDQLTSEVIEGAVSKTKLERYNIREVTDTIMRGAQKTFAILVLINKPASIVSFIEKDNFQPIALDSRLPFDREALHERLEHDYLVEKFYEQQAQFTAPIFSGNAIPRLLGSPIIFPFLHCGDDRRGGFGIVFKVTIPREHQTFAQGCHYSTDRGGHGTASSTSEIYTLARKKIIRSSRRSKADYELELRNLSILKLVHHPHIVQLLGSYTHLNEDNFLFPWIEDSLESILHRERPADLWSDYSMIMALCGLSSALALVHNFRDGDFEAIGCHHDLKPSNILVEGGKFLLADFGLSRFKAASEESRTTFQTARGDYIAPECQGRDYPYANHDIHRSADVWSFACIILEILVYMEEGHEGIKLFREGRRYTINQNTCFRFHGQTGRATIVDEKLRELKMRDLELKRRPADLAESMLNVPSPGSRPRIASVDATLRSILISDLTQRLGESYQVAHAMSSSIAILYEQRRLESWTWAILHNQRGTNSEEMQVLQGFTYSEFQSALGSLENIKRALQDFNTQSLPLRDTISSIRHMDDQLFGLLPPNLRENANLRLQCTVLETKNLDHLQNLQESSDRRSNSHSIRRLAAIRQLHLLVDQLTVDDRANDVGLCINHTRLKGFGDISGNLKMGYLEYGTASSQLVLAEWRHYFDHYSKEDHDIIEQMVIRTRQITAELKLASQNPEFCILPSVGYYHNKMDHSVGLVYKLQGLDQQAEQKVEVKALRDIFSDTKQPLLETKFHLACSLASSLLSFHSIGWLQKSISSYNTIFRFADGVPSDAALCAPYFVGFLSSRQASVFAFSEGPTVQGKDVTKLYEHPAYLSSDGARFRQEFDYYSLGVVLMEIGLWRVAESFLPDKLEKGLSALGQTMGSKYREAVRACLFAIHDDRNSQPTSAEETSAGISLRFKEEVIDKLRQCRV